MGNTISFQYPLEYIVLCVLFALGVSLLIYFRSKNWTGHPAWITGLLALSRFLVALVMALLFMGPLFRLTETHVQQPVIAILHDASQSVTLGLSPEDSLAFIREMTTLETDLSEHYRVETISFGSHIRSGFDFAFEDPETNIYEALTYAFEQFGDQNLGAVVLATDGIFNKGGNPLYLRTGISAPVFPIALGDTSIQRDVLVRNAYANQIAYLGDRFRTEVDISARNAPGTQTRVSIHRISGGQRVEVASETLNIDSDDFFVSLEFILEANEPGLQRYQIHASPVPNESNLANNTRDIFVNVLDARQKILILAHSPHPDIGAIRSALEQNRNYEVEVVYPDAANEINLAPYDLIVLHQFPSTHSSWPSIAAALNNQPKPVLYIRGQQTQINALRDRQQLILMPRISGSTNEVQARWNPLFSLFNISESTVNMISRFPPLHSTFGEFETHPSAQTAVYQRIGNVETTYPLITFGERNGVREGIIFGEGIFRWRLYNQAQHESQDAFNELIDRSIQFLTLKEDRRRFRLSMANNLVQETEPVIIQGELYNQAFQLINQPEVNIVITDENEREYLYSMDRTADAYQLNAGFLPVGEYRYRGNVTLDGRQHTDQGMFSIRPVQLERYVTVANHSLLYQLAGQSGGRVVYPGQVSDLKNDIQNRGDVKPMMYQTASALPVIHYHWIFAGLLFLLAMEWVVRRYRSTY